MEQQYRLSVFVVTNFVRKMAKIQDTVVAFLITFLWIIVVPEIFRRNPNVWNDMIFYFGKGDDRMAYVVGTNLWHLILFIFFNSCLLLPYSLNHPTIEKFKTEKHVEWPWHSKDSKIRKEFWDLLWFSFGVVLVNNLAISLPMSYLSFNSAREKGCFSFSFAEFPSTFTILWQVPVFILVEDCLFYWAHRMLHIPFLFKYIHKIHHKHHCPVGIASECAHPVEFYFGNMLPFSLGPILLKAHSFTFWLWFAIRLAKTCEAHSGYSFPWSPFQFIPFANPAGAHDHHHFRGITSCYGSFLSVWDRAMSTCGDYSAQAKKEKATEKNK
jgi:sterol desaturase/sphingolipid hydroxylase (fatty acid hydroxylase superfamily)